MKVSSLQYQFQIPGSQPSFQEPSSCSHIGSPIYSAIHYLSLTIYVRRLTSLGLSRLQYDHRYSRMPKDPHRPSPPIKKERSRRSLAAEVVSEQSCFADPVAFEELLSGSYWPSSTHRPTVSSPTESALSGITSLSLSSSTSSKSSSHSRSRSSQSSKMAPSDRHDSSKSSKQSGKSSSSSDASRSSSGKGRRTAPSSQFRCKICGQYYSRRDNLRVHQRVHSGEMPYNCKYCGQEFRWLGSLRSHESNHERDGDTAGFTPRSSSGSGSGSRHVSSRHSSSRQTSSRQQPAPHQSSSRHSSSRNQATEQPRQSGTSSSRARHGTSSGSRSRHHVPSSNVERTTPRGQDVIITDEDPGLTSIIQEPWHRVLDDEH